MAKKKNGDKPKKEIVWPTGTAHGRPYGTVKVVIKKND